MNTVKNLKDVPVEEFLCNAIECVTYIRSAYLLLYFDAFEIIYPFGILSVILLSLNITNAALKNNRQDDDVVVSSYSDYVKRFLPVVVLFLAYGGDPTMKSVEMSRLNAIVRIVRDVRKPDNNSSFKCISTQITKKLHQWRENHKET